jgi:hypothetical protein
VKAGNTSIRSSKAVRWLIQPPLSIFPSSRAAITRSNSSGRALREASSDSALQLLGLLQQEGRLVDFLQEDVSAYSDADIGGAARVVHEGCRKTLLEHLSIEPVRTEEEGVRITLADGFDASSVRLTGNVVGKPPFTGTLMHRGWRVSAISLPKLAAGHQVQVVAPAEVEL